MPLSQNGFSANDRNVIASYTVPGTNLRIALRKGDVSVVLLEYLRRYHLEVEPLPHSPQDLWGYAERTIRGSSTTLSNHASGTAVDCRATRHPLGAVGTFTSGQRAALDRLLAWFEGVLRHGKDYTGRKDEMHAEINRGPSEVTRIADKIRSGTGGGTPSPLPAPSREDDDLTPEQDKLLRTLYDQVTGNNFAGWETWEGGTNEKLTLVDFARRDNVEVRQIHHNLASVHSKLDALGARVAAIDGGEAPPPDPASLSTADLLAELARRVPGATS